MTDYANNLQRIGRIIALLDVSNVTGVEVIALRHAVASDLAPLVLSLAEGSSNPGSPLPASNGNGAGNLLNASATGVSGNAFPTTLIPEPRSNSIIVRTANAARMAQIKRIIQQLDIPPSASGEGGGSSGNIHIVHLKNVDATKLAVTLRAALAALPDQTKIGRAHV